MRSVTLYFTPGTNRRLARIRTHLGGSLSHVIAHVLAVAEQAMLEDPTARPWETELPSTEAASRHTIYLHTRSDQRLQDLRTGFQDQEAKPGQVILQSVVVARAIALAEQPILELSPDEIELKRLQADAIAIDVEVSHLEEDWGEEAINKLLGCMHQTSALITRAQKVKQRTEQDLEQRRLRAIRSDASRLITGPLNDLMGRISRAITNVRRETDHHQEKSSAQNRKRR